MTSVGAQGGPANENPPAPAPIRFEARAMASPLRLAIHGMSAEDMESAWSEVRDEFEASEEAMSRFRETSELTLLNRASVDGHAVSIGARLRRALVAADRARRITDGSFEPRLVRDLDRLGYRGVPVDAPWAGDAPRAGEEHRGVPRRGPTAESRSPGSRVVELGPGGCIRVSAPVDLGGIGKGLALRWAAARIRRRLPPAAGALLEAGGDLVAIGGAPDGGPWLVGVEDPSGGTTPLAAVAVLDAAVATSSIAVHRWIAPTGEPVHHLVDPATGRPGGVGLVAVTVLGPDPAWAEVRTKQLFLAGPRGIGPLARSLGLAAWWVTAGGELEMTPAARVTTAWSAPARSS